MYLKPVSNKTIFLQSADNSRRISTHFTSLLAEREAHIEKLEEKETSLQQSLVSKVTSESELKQERKFLLSVSEKKQNFLYTTRSIDTTISSTPNVSSVYIPSLSRYH